MPQPARGLRACPDSGEALAINPLDHGQCLQVAKAKGWRIPQVLNTHEHHDHTGRIGNSNTLFLAHDRPGTAPDFA